MRKLALPNCVAQRASARRRGFALLLSVMVAATACGGARFSGSEATAGSSAGGSDSATAGAAGRPGAVATSPGGQASLGGDASVDGGEASSGLAGEAAVAGAAGAGGTSDCAELGGFDFSAHCYVDVTTESVAQAAAVAACVTFSSQVGRKGQLLVLDSAEEQAFVLSHLLSEFTDVSDAWLNLTCDSLQFPEFTSCYCNDCNDQLATKRAVWSWLDGSTANFGWVGKNPDGEGRCSALAYNPSNSTWGWVDRSCTKATHQLPGYPAHDYRTICELE